MNVFLCSKDDFTIILHPATIYENIILEQSNDVGGRVKTRIEKGYPLDIGFQVLLSAYPLVKEYLDMDSLDLEKLRPGAQIYVNKNTYQIGDPSRDFSFLFSTLFANVGSLRDKLKILKLNLRLKQKSLGEIFDSPEASTYDYLVQFGFSSKSTFFTIICPPLRGGFFLV